MELTWDRITRIGTRRRAFVSLAVLALAAAGAKSVAAQPAGNVRTREVLVGRSGGDVEIPVNRAYVTALYFPDEIEKVLAAPATQERFTITPLGNSVVVRPLTDKPVTGNVQIISQSIRVSVLLRIGEKSEAVTQVFVRSESVESEVAERVDAEVTRRLAAMEAEYGRRQAELDREVERKTAEEVAARMLERRERVQLKARARNDESVVVRVEDALVLGSDVYLVYSIENRSGSPYRVARVRAHLGGRGDKTLPGLAWFEGRAQWTGRLADSRRTRAPERTGAGATENAARETGKPDQHAKRPKPAKPKAGQSNNGKRSISARTPAPANDAAPGLLGTVPDAATRTGVLVVQGGQRWMGTALTLVVTPVGGDGAIEVGGIVLR